MDLPSMIAAIAASDHTYEEIAAEIGVSQPTISRWASGETTPNYERIERVRALYRKVQGLTNEAGTSDWGGRVKVCGALAMSGEAREYQAPDIKEVSTDLRIPDGAKGFEALETLSGFRARRGDLLIFGPAVDPIQGIDRDVLATFATEHGERTMLVILTEGRTPGRYELRAGTDVIDRNADVARVCVFKGLIAAGEWKLAT